MKTELLETLIAFNRTGSITEAATSLRISQSAASKRLSSLEKRLDQKLFRREGRGLYLTSHGKEIAAHAQEALQSLQSLLTPRLCEIETLSLGISDSILSSWGAPLLARIKKQLRGINLNLHAHRSPIIVDKTMIGKFDIGICAGSPSVSNNLIRDLLISEPMVFVGCGPRLRDQSPNVITIERSASTWKSIRPQFKSMGIKAIQRIESFAAAANLAYNGHGIALVPIGIATRLKKGAARNAWIEESPIQRPIHLVYKKSALGTKVFDLFQQRLVSECAALDFSKR